MNTTIDQTKVQEAYGRVAHLRSLAWQEQDRYNEDSTEWKMAQARAQALAEAMTVMEQTGGIK